MCYNFQLTAAKQGSSSLWYTDASLNGTKYAMVENESVIVT